MRLHAHLGREQHGPPLGVKSLFWTSTATFPEKISLTRVQYGHSGRTPNKPGTRAEKTSSCILTCTLDMGESMCAWPCQGGVKRVEEEGGG